MARGYRLVVSGYWGPDLRRLDEARPMSASVATSRCSDSVRGQPINRKVVPGKKRQSFFSKPHKIEIAIGLALCLRCADSKSINL
jgi:hypothetical protein